VRYKDIDGKLLHTALVAKPKPHLSKYKIKLSTFHSKLLAEKIYCIPYFHRILHQWRKQLQ